MSATVTLVACCVRAAACLPDDALVVAADLPRAEALRVLALQVKREHDTACADARASERAAIAGWLRRCGNPGTAAAILRGEHER